MTTPVSEVQAAMRAEAARVERLTIKAFEYPGTQCVTCVRDRGGDESWYDQSGNLRSSVGYVIAKNGVIVSSSAFEQVRQGSEGSASGRQLAEEIARRYTGCYSLIVVAGMNYAAYVEAKDNKDVLGCFDGAMGQRPSPKILEQLKRAKLQMKSDIEIVNLVCRIIQGSALATAARRTRVCDMGRPALSVKEDIVVYLYLPTRLCGQIQRAYVNASAYVPDLYNGKAKTWEWNKERIDTLCDKSKFLFYLHGDGWHIVAKDCQQTVMPAGVTFQGRAYGTLH
ncbi:MAG: hypothetical protein ACLR8Y_02015 [Alistipes indistinctus]